MSNCLLLLVIPWTTGFVVYLLYLGWNNSVVHHLMRQRNLVLIFGILSVAFIVFQLRLFLKFPKTEQKTDYFENGIPSAYVSIQAFMEICHRHGFPVFLIDPILLKVIMNNSSSLAICSGDPCPADCRYLCADYPVMTFGVIDQLWKMEVGYEDFHAKGFLISEFFQTASHDLIIRLRNKTNIPTHYLFQHGNKHLIHLVVFYERQNNFFWHGTFNQMLDGTASNVLLHFGMEEGAYTSLDLVKVKMDGLKLRAPSYPLAFLGQISESRFIECNQSRAKIFYEMNGQPDATVKAKHFYASAKDLLSITKRVLDEIGVRFWISSGTCLGWFRQCDLIPYSKDVDIGVWITDYKAQLIPSMQNVGLDLIHVFGKVNDSYELSFSGGEVKLDIFFFYDEQDYMWNGGTQARTGKKFKYLFPKFQLCWTLFLELKVRVPCETLKYVEANYGQNWFEPVKTWDWKKSPPNVHENGQWSESERKNVIQIYS